MTAPLFWISIVAPPYNDTTVRVVITRPNPGETDGAACARAALLAFPDILITELSIKGVQLYDDVLLPDDLLDRPLFGLDVVNAQRVVEEQLPDHQTSN